MLIFNLIFLSIFLLTGYDAEHKKSLENPEDYWAEIASEVVWSQKWDKVLDNTKQPFTQWFSGGRLSMCYNAVDRHVDEGRGDTKALIWDSPITSQKSDLTYTQLKDKVLLLF